MNQDTQASPDLLRECVRDLLTAGIKTRGYHLLSQLGQELGPDVGRIRADTGKKLRDYVEAEFADLFDVKPIQELGKNIFGAVPKGMPVSAIELQRPDKSSGSDRFHGRFWAAFSVPITASRRLISLQDFTFHDADSAEGSRDVFRVIEPGYVASSGIEERDVTIKENIHRWLADQELHRAFFVLRKSKRLVGSGLASRQSPVSILDAITSSLDRSQLQRNSLPLDVIVALAKRTV